MRHTIPTRVHQTISFLTCLFLTVASLTAADLSDAQKKMLDEAKWHLKQAETNLNLAEGTSRAQLALMRSGSAKTSIAQVNARLDKLPADNSDVKATREQSDTVAGQIAELETKLTGGAPAEKPGTKMDYKQEESLKDARFNTREVEGRAAAVAQVVEEVGKIENKDYYDHRRANAAMNTIAEARQKSQNAQTRLDALPAEGQGVPEVAAALKKANESLDASHKTLEPIHARLMSLVNPANYPKLAEDIKRLSELAGMYANPEQTMLEPAKAAELYKTGSAAHQERVRVTKEYAVLIAQQTDEGKRIAGVSQHLGERLTAFAALAKEKKTTLPTEIQADLDAANKLADQAVAEKKPAFFGENGGIAQQMGFATEKLVLLKAIDEPASVELQKTVDAAVAEMKKRADLLSESIIQNNTLPPDQYQGEDRAEIEKMATEAWLKVMPEAKVLKVRIRSERWQRELIWRNQTGDWYKIDRSRLQAILVVARDEKIAELRPINMWIDHLKGDTRTAFPMDEKDDKLPPQRLMLIEKVGK